METSILYFDCFSGISGDMTIAALLDLGIDQNLFLKNLEKLHLNEYSLEIKKGMKNGISGTDFSVNVFQKADVQEVSKSKNFLGQIHLSTDQNVKPDHKLFAENQNHQDHPNSRNLNDIFRMIDTSELSDFVKHNSKRVFQIIGEAEAKIHAKSIEEIHFHEVGAVDSIVDIVGAVICLEILRIDTIISSPLNLGSGMVKCEHGMFPVPAPATLEIVKNIPVYSGQIEKELTTPTGAAIIKAFAQSYGKIPEMYIEKTAYGLGKRTFEVPNVLRVILGKKKKI